MMHRKALRTTAFLAVVGLTIAGCGTNELEPESEPVPTQTAPVEDSKEPVSEKADEEWNAEWDENRSEEAKEGDLHFLSDGSVCTHAEMEAKRENLEPTFDSTPVEDIDEDDLPITEGSFSAEKLPRDVLVGPATEEEKEC